MVLAWWMIASESCILYKLTIDTSFSLTFDFNLMSITFFKYPVHPQFKIFIALIDEIKRINIFFLKKPHQTQTPRGWNKIPDCYWRLKSLLPKATAKPQSKREWKVGLEEEEQHLHPTNWWSMNPPDGQLDTNWYSNHLWPILAGCFGHDNNKK